MARGQRRSYEMDMGFCCNVDCLSDNDRPLGVSLFRDFPAALYSDQSASSSSYRINNPSQPDHNCSAQHRDMPSRGHLGHRGTYRPAYRYFKGNFNYVTLLQDKAGRCPCAELALLIIDQTALQICARGQKLF